jgi:hypothetical protein
MIAVHPDVKCRNDTPNKERINKLSINKESKSRKSTKIRLCTLFVKTQAESEYSNIPTIDA